MDPEHDTDPQRPRAMKSSESESIHISKARVHEVLRKLASEIWNGGDEVTAVAIEDAMRELGVLED